MPTEKLLGLVGLGRFPEYPSGPSVTGLAGQFPAGQASLCQGGELVRGFLLCLPLPQLYQEVCLQLGVRFPIVNELESAL